MFKKVKPAIFAALLLGPISTAQAGPCESDGTCQSLEAVYMCAKETDSDLAKYLASDDVAFKKNGSSGFDYTVVQRFADYAAWYEDYKKYTALHGQYAKLYDFENLIKSAEKQGELVDAKTINEFKNRQYKYYNNLVRYYPKDKTFTDLDRLESKAKSAEKYLFVPAPKMPLSQDSRYKKINQKVNILNKSFKAAASTFASEQGSCMETFCHTNCSIPMNPDSSAIESYRSTLNLPMAMADANVIEEHVTRQSESCLSPAPTGNRKLLLCSVCKDGLLGKNDIMLPSCDGLSDKEMYSGKVQSEAPMF